MHTHVPLSSSSINLMPASAEKVWRTVGLASHWPCVTDMVFPPTGSQPWEGRWAPRLRVLGVWHTLPLYCMAYLHSMKSNLVYGFYPRDVVMRCTCYGNVSGWLAGWLGGWVSVTRRYCIKTAKPIWKPFQPSESTIILLYWDPYADIQF